MKKTKTKLLFTIQNTWQIAFFALILQCLGLNAYAQTNTEKDLADFFTHSSKKAEKYKKDSLDFEQGKATFSVLPAVGYSLTTLFAANVAANLAFKYPNANVSSFSIVPTITSRKQILIPIRGTIWTKNNKYNMVTDVRIMKYPQSTYGLGSDSELSNKIPMDYYYIRLHETIYTKINSNFLFGIGLHYDYRWNISADLPVPETPKSVYFLGLPSKSNTTGISLNLLHDNRHSSIFPTDGMYFNLNLRQNFKVLGSNYNSNTLQTDTRKYIKLSPTKDNILAFWNFNWLTLGGKLPYLDLPATAWDTYNNTGRGYIQGRFRGYNFFYFETELRMQLTKNKLLGGVIFANFQTVSEGNNFQFNKLFPGIGTGLRIKVNKLSNTNLGLDYGWGAKGSHGLFLNIGEVF